MLSPSFPSAAGRPPSDASFLRDFDRAMDARHSADYAELQMLRSTFQVAAREREAFRARCAKLEIELAELREKYASELDAAKERIESLIATIGARGAKTDGPAV